MGNFLTLPAGVQDSTGVPAASVVTANTRVKASTGNVAIATDILSFPGPSSVGNWLVPNSRTLVNGVPTIGQGCSGQALVPAVPTSVPITIVTTDPRAAGS